MNAILIDFGSTFTKIIIFDMEKASIIARAQSPSTVQTDITIGLEKALNIIDLKINDLKKRKFDHQLSCSSAAGGLKMIAIGLVPELTVEAAKEAALGAGANVIGTYSYNLNLEELKRIEAQNPDIILLAGGSDGGDEKTVLHNAEMLAKSKIKSPIIIACNKSASENVEGILKKSKNPTRITENVMPELWRLNIEPTKGEIRKIFLERIIEAKGLDKVRKFVDIIIPTPSASLKAVDLLARGIGNHKGIGDLLTIEVGGATTNVYSASEGISDKQNVILRGFKEPYLKRTVEGDLGLRYNVFSIIEKAGIKEFKSVLSEEELKEEQSIQEKAKYLKDSVAFISKSNKDRAFDEALSRVAVRIAVKRHSGQLVKINLPSGASFIQEGKDLSKVKNILGSGGGIVYAKNHKRILSEAIFNPNERFILKPKDPKLFIDKDYVLWATGLLSQVDRETAYSIISKSLIQI
jgi:uncharacterized protein (TIGR01319 family)